MRQVIHFAEMVMDFLEEGNGQHSPILGWCWFRDAVRKDRFEVAEGGSEVTERLKGWVPEVVTNLVLGKIDLDFSGGRG